MKGSVATKPFSAAKQQYELYCIPILSKSVVETTDIWALSTLCLRMMGEVEVPINSFFYIDWNCT